MKFYGRQNELEILTASRIQSTRTACFTVIIGRRRIGKTSLLLASVQDQPYIYLFVSRKNEQLLSSQFQEEIEKAMDFKIYGTMTSFRDVFEQLLVYSIDKHYTLIIDEFQEFEYVNPAIFSDIQYLWDKYKDQAKMNFIVCGSVYSMMLKIFENRKEPLFGRLTSKMIIKPFPVSTMKEILKDYHPNYKPEDLLCLYAITGGVAKYITLLMEAGATTVKKIFDYVTRTDSPFLSEGKDLLISEFGKEYGTYFSILQLIAAGKTTQPEIDSIVGKNTGAYLSNLENEYSLVSRSKPMFAKPETRKSRWNISDNFLRFWFRFIYPNQSMLELGKNELLREYINVHYTQYSGHLLEKYFRDKLAEGRITAIGSYWDGKGENEIDIIALNDLDKTAIIAEVKRNTKKINIELLKTKALSIQKQLGNYEVELKGYSLEDM
ncbi:ATP-binding protein [Pedobacter africanus]|uniref:DUF234 domain-containing protein n=1 Tax=Pedobacter africanus TaxID=151894 RepID=A0A1W2BRL5_9SPHI|nr:ATP-binding protein [Pedobacter africanus]SMC75511.1 hypothetical protein SAMN04488524_2579 [Pedobacter africanus]